MTTGQRRSTDVKPANQWAAVFPYVDVTAIQDRLDLVVGPERHDMIAVDDATLSCRMRLYKTPRAEIGQGTNRWSQSANAFERCARHLRVGRYLTQLPPVRLKLGSDMPVNSKGAPYITDELLDRLRGRYEQQVREMQEQFGQILPHPGVGAGEAEGEIPVHPEMDPEAGTPEESGNMVISQSNPQGLQVQSLANERGVTSAKLANLIRVAAGGNRIAEEKAAGQLREMLQRITEPIAEQTVELIEMLHPAGEQHASAGENARQAASNDGTGHVEGEGGAPSATGKSRARSASETRPETLAEAGNQAQPEAAGGDGFNAPGAVVRSLANVRGVAPAELANLIRVGVQPDRQRAHQRAALGARQPRVRRLADQAVGIPVAVQRRIEFKLAPDLEWTIEGHLDLETQSPDLDGEPFGEIVDYKVKSGDAIGQKADRDPQASLYLAGRWLERRPADRFAFAQVLRPGIC